ncbi:MAG TPA: DUF302 domain-containing protein [Gammaproteobacteria bacterium]|nr:DUF302 domain-containing protein [Gammaproteobacteria bacterium]
MRHWPSVLTALVLAVALGAGTAPALADAPVPPPTAEPPAPRSPMVYVKRVGGDFETVYKRVFDSLENNSFFVLFEPNIGRNLKLYASRWGKDYNRNHLDEIRSIVFCNGAYANQVSNADPQMLALCPLHVTLIHKNGVTSILFVRPSRVATGTPAERVALDMEQDVIRAVESGVRSLPPPPATSDLKMPPVPVKSPHPNPSP